MCLNHTITELKINVTQFNEYPEIFNKKIKKGEKKVLKFFSYLNIL